MDPGGRHVIHGYEGVGFAAAKGGLDLDDRVAALAAQSLFHPSVW